jgi:hypothetical protein
VIEEKGTELYVSTDGEPSYLLFSEEIKKQFEDSEIRSAGYNEHRKLAEREHPSAPSTTISRQLKLTLSNRIDRAIRLQLA